MFKLNSLEEINLNAPLGCGVYRIFWIKNGHPEPIRRIGGIDETGLLYIGHTQGSLRDRLNHFRCSAFLNSTNHSGGKKYRLNRKLSEIIKPDEIFAETFKVKNSNNFEIEELRKYSNCYGEVPPLNG